MSIYLKNCWEIRNCELERDGRLCHRFGECPASRAKMGHSCWVVTNTLCVGEPQGTASEKINTCMKCEVYKRYNRKDGIEKNFIKTCIPEEERRYFLYVAKERSRRQKRAA